MKSWAVNSTERQMNNLQLCTKTACVPISLLGWLRWLLIPETAAICQTLPSGQWKKCCEKWMTWRAVLGEASGVGKEPWNRHMGWKPSPALLSPRQASAASRAGGKNRVPLTRTGPGLCLCAGAGPEAWEPGCCGLHSCLVLHLARVSSSTEQAWGRRPSKYFGLSLDPELCNTCTHKTYFVAFATGAWHVNLSHPTAAWSGVAWSAAWSASWSVVCAAISVCSPQIRVLMSGMLDVWKLFCLNSQWSWDSSRQSWI